jgi:hypothetical protein
MEISEPNIVVGGLQIGYIWSEFFLLKACTNSLDGSFQRPPTTDRIIFRVSGDGSIPKAA